MITLYASLAAATLGSASTASDMSRMSRGGSHDSIPLWNIVSVAQPSDTQPRRRRSLEYSEWYSRRLAIHRLGSYTMLPLFAAEYVLGNQLLHGNDGSGMKPAHVAVATGIGGLFTVNTVTGAWNWWDSRSDPAGRGRRTIHTIAMLASDAGFVWAGAIGDRAGQSNANARQHRNVALGSIGVATLGTAMMWFWKN